jgi:hypothetical protein
MNETLKPAAARGFALRCILCGTTDGTRRLHLDDLQVISCDECNDEFLVETLRDAVAEAARLLAWIDAAPKQE